MITFNCGPDPITTITLTQTAKVRNSTQKLVIDGGQPNDPHFQNYPGIFYIGSGDPIFTNSTIQ